MITVRDMSCCGVKELNGVRLQSAPETIRLILKQYVTYGKTVLGEKGLPGFFIFTDAVKMGGRDYAFGENLAALIKKEKLGVIKESPVRLNRMNYTDHFDRVWTWAPSIEGLNRWAEKDKAEREKGK